jgi:hypothetical protein
MATNPNSAQGIQVPVVPSGAGGFRLVSGDEYITQLVVTLSSDCDSDNPYQEEGIALDAVFALASDSAWKARVRRDVEAVFRKVLERQNLAKLIRVTFEPGATEGEYNMNLRYMSIESATEADVVVPLRRG